MRLSKSWTTVTPFSKTLAMILVILLPFIGFYFGYNFPHTINYSTATPTKSVSSSDETTNWKTYTDTTYTFIYPSDWTVQGGYDDYFKGHTVTIKNPKQTVVLNVYPKQPPYGFNGPQPKTTAQDISVIVDGQNFVGREITFENIKAYADLKVSSAEKYHILFGTGYPAGSDTNSSLSDYHADKNTILQILSTFKFTN